MRRMRSPVVGSGVFLIGVVLTLHIGAMPVAGQPWRVSHLAGPLGGPGSTDGVGSAARFDTPKGVAVDAAGVVYVADTPNHTIRKVQPDGTVTVLAGLAGWGGTADGVGGAARFSSPVGVAVDASGVLYVADTGNSTIRKVQPNGTVTTLAGLAGEFGSADGVGSGARFDWPTGVAVDAAGAVYVADTNNCTIRKVQPNGTVTTLAGLAGEFGSDDGVGSNARFDSPTGVGVDAAGVVYVADVYNHTIRKIQPNGTVTTLAGLAAPLGGPGSTDGVGSAARFREPNDIAVGGAGVVYVADTGNHTIRKIQPDGTVTTLAGLAGTSGSADGIGSSARFSGPTGIAVEAAGVVFVGDTSNHTIRKIQPSADVTTLAGLAGAYGSTDGVGSAARFRSPMGVAVDDVGVVYVADTYNHTIRKVQLNGTVTTLAGAAGSPGSADGVGSAARFYYPAGVAVDAAGVVYIADTGNCTIRKIQADGTVTTLAGAPGDCVITDGPRFNLPYDVAVDAAGVVYVADTGNCTIRRVQPNGTVTTLAGQASAVGGCSYADGLGSAARFNHPRGIAVTAAGHVYVADSENHIIRHVRPDGMVTTLAGLAGAGGNADGGVGKAQFYSPEGIAVDGAGVVYVADWGNHTIRKMQPDQTVTTVAGLAGATGSADGIGSAARFYGPYGVAVNAAGTRMVVAEEVNHAIRDALPVPDDQDLDGLLDVWETAMGLNPQSAGGDDGTNGDPDHDGKTNLEEYGAGTHPRGFYTRYFAEGATGALFDYWIALLNPGSSLAHVNLRFLRRVGGPVSYQRTVPAMSRRTVVAKQVPGVENADAVSTVVESDVLIVADRTMSWDASGYGGHAETSIASPAVMWYLAEGATHSGFDLFYLIQNPNPSAVTVRVAYLRPAPLPPIVKDYLVAANSRFNIWVDLEEFPSGSGNRTLAQTDVSAILQSLTPSLPIIVERAMYLSLGQEGQPGYQFFGAGHDSAGVTAAVTNWFLAEGATGDYFDLYILLANPGWGAPANVTIRYLLPNGTTVTLPYVVAASSRKTIFVNGEHPDLANTPVSAVVTSDQPIIVERAMWWPGPTWATWFEAHNSPGARETGTKWAVADVEHSGTRDTETYILIANTSPYAGQVKVTLVFEDGTAPQELPLIDLPANSRTTTYWLKTGGARQRFSAIVESVGATPAQIVVERAQYWDALGVHWAAGTNALGTRLQ